ncbi:Prefoldin subunit 1 [Cichlidogyrus casuarinus]|uniref:Prefoldin subunit 1 n=1 Tax=Cichlidogyrus casuarinus TaxID=1844966 RepID=A0ABD2Q4C5_9PLAT
MSGKDAEISEAINEHRSRQFNSQKEIRRAGEIIFIAEKDRARNKVVLAEVNNTADTVNMYRTLGRMFVLTPKKELIPFLEKKAEEIEETIKEGKATIETMEKHIKTSENRLRELIASKQSQAAAT